MIPGRATAAGTSGRGLPARPGLDGLAISTVCPGTYLGPADDATDRLYEDALRAALAGGCTLVDCAGNYRYQRSERALGRVLREVPRESVAVCTKAGFLPFDGPEGREEWFRRELFEPGVVATDDLAGSHVLSPRYVRWQAENSRRNLDLATLDVLYLHNPETWLRERGFEEFRLRLRACFEELERLADEGWIAFYGVATWSGLRVPPEQAEHLSLEGLALLAREIGGEGHRFRAVQAPLNLGMPEAAVADTQEVGGRRMPLLRAAGELGLTAFASASLMQGRAVESLPAVRSVTTALVGMTSLGHVRRNLEVAARPPLDPEEALQTFFRTEE